MAGYTRQSVADIIANAIIKAAPVNAEFNTIRDAFAQATGHAHDGTSAEGAYVPLISDPNAFNKVVIDSGNNRISFYNDVSSVAVEQVRIEDGVFVPVTDNDVDLGAAGAEFKDLYIDGVGYIDTLAVHENATVAGTLDVTGLSTLATVDIDGGNIDGTVIGASSAAAGGFTTVTTSGQAALTSVNIDGGTIDGTTVGITVPAAGAFTTLSSTTGITGDVTGNVTGNLTGNSAGVHTGAVTGDVTGNITAATGSSSFNNVTINGSLDMNSVSSATVTGLSTPVLASDAATKGYVDGEVAALVDAAPGTLDTLNELAAALGDDPNYAATTAASIATKLPLAGGTMTGAIAMGTSKITGMGDPTAAQDAATKAYSDTQGALKVTKAGDTMSGALAMGSNQITGLAAPTLGGDATNKTYVDAILGSATAASASAAAAAVSEANAATSETNAATSESNAATSEANAAASYDSFDDRYLGAKASSPTLDNDGDALVIGALYFNSTTNIMNVYGSGGWQSAGSAVNGTSDRNTYTATAGQTVFAATYDTGYVDVYLNGVKLVASTDFTATNGTSITLTTGAAVNDVVDIVAYGTFVLADHYTEAQSDARYVQVAGDSMTGGLNITSGNLGIGTSSPSNSLHVSGTSGTPVLLERTNGAACTIAFKGNATTNNPYLGANGDSLYFNTGTSEAMRIDSSGNVIATSGSLNLVGTNTQMFASANGQDIQFKFAGVKKAQINNSGLISSSDGNATVPGFRFVDDANTGMFRAATDTLAFSTAGSEAMRINNGNLLVGKTAAGIANNGIELRANNDVLVTNDGNVALYLNRKSSEGDIVEFRKDGSTVGTIAAYGGDLNIGTGNLRLKFTDSVPAFLPRKANDANSDNYADLGDVNNRFKDLHLAGTANAANFNTTSDATLKTNVETLTGSLDAVKSLRGVSFDWLENGNSEVGFIAQEVEEVVPEVVSTNDQGIKSVKYGNMVALLIEAMKEQQAQIDELKAKLGGISHE